MSWFYNVLLVMVTILFVNKVACCPDGWMTHQSACYLFSHDSQNWIGAMQMCREWEGQLVEIGDDAKTSFLKRQARLYNKNFWIALSDVEKENTWVWMSSRRAMTQDDFSNWHKGQPNNFGSDENCVAIDYTKNYDWVDYACMSNFHYICELPENTFGQIVG